MTSSQVIHLLSPRPRTGRLDLVAESRRKPKIKGSFPGGVATVERVNLSGRERLRSAGRDSGCRRARKSDAFNVEDDDLQLPTPIYRSPEARSPLHPTLPSDLCRGSEMKEIKEWAGLISWKLEKTEGISGIACGTHSASCRSCIGWVCIRRGELSPSKNLSHVGHKRWQKK